MTMTYSQWIRVEDYVRRDHPELAQEVGDKLRRWTAQRGEEPLLRTKITLHLSSEAAHRLCLDAYNQTRRSR